MIILFTKCCVNLFDFIFSTKLHKDETHYSFRIRETKTVTMLCNKCILVNAIDWWVNAKERKGEQEKRQAMTNEVTIENICSIVIRGQFIYMITFYMNSNMLKRK